MPPEVCLRHDTVVLLQDTELALATILNIGHLDRMWIVKVIFAFSSRCEFFSACVYTSTTPFSSFSARCVFINRVQTQGLEFRMFDDERLYCVAVFAENSKFTFELEVKSWGFQFYCTQEIASFAKVRFTDVGLAPNQTAVATQLIGQKGLLTPVSRRLPCNAPLSRDGPVFDLHGFFCFFVLFLEWFRFMIALCVFLSLAGFDGFVVKAVNVCERQLCS